MLIFKVPNTKREYEIGMKIICLPSTTAIKLANKRSFSCMCSLVYLQVLRASEQLPTPRKRTWERFLTSVYTEMVDQFVFRFECNTGSLAILPEAHVLGRVVEANMVFGQVLDDIHHDEELFATGFAFGRVIGPHA